MNFSISRWDDHEYLVQIQGFESGILFSVENAEHQNEYELVRVCAEKVLQDAGKKVDKAVAVLHRDVEWKVEPVSKHTMIKKAVSKLTDFVHKESDLSVPRLKISGSGFKALPQQKIVAQFEGTTTRSAFRDSFTKCAAFAYQHGYEGNYSAKDNFTPDMSDTRIVLVNDVVMLVAAKEHSLLSLANNKNTVSAYYDFIVKEYGPQRVLKAERDYGIDLQRMIKQGEPLTPEHVYRLNIGLARVDRDDLEDLVSKLPSLKSACEKATQTQTAGEVLQEVGLPLRYLHAFELEGSSGSEDDTESSGSEMSAADSAELFLDWISFIDPLPKTLSECTEAELQELMRPFHLDELAFERSLTGRKIHKPLQSGYTTAELGKEKLWVDHQELAQVFRQMQTTDSWDLWLEKLDHVVVKANLLDGNDETGYKLSTIIPAPVSADGHPRWYQVTRLVSNGHGVFTYTIVPLGADSSLPSIFVARSTASSEYAFHGTESLLNDLNSLNPPGYEGQILNAPYDAEFFKDYTIPKWVGYLEVARTAKEQDEVYSNLRKANFALHDAFIKKHETKTLQAVIREYDWLLNRIGLELAYSDLVTSYLGIYKKMLKVYAADEHISHDQMVQDATALKVQLEKCIEKVADHYVVKGIYHLIAELDSHVITNAQDTVRDALYKKACDGFFGELDRLQTSAELAYKHGYSDQIPDILKQWQAALYAKAKDDGELLEQKKKHGLIVTGQSLGGAISQVALVRQLALQERVPVTFVENYTISSPGIRHEDQERFIAYAERTGELRSKLGSEIKITHLTEAGDVVFLAGEGHLGAAHTNDEAESIARSVVFRGEVREMIPGAMEYTTVHETQFMHATPGTHYDVHLITSKDLAKIDDAKYVISKNAAEKKKLQKEHESYKNRFKYSRVLDGEFLNKVAKNSLLIRRHLDQKRKKATGKVELDTQGVFVVG